MLLRLTDVSVRILIRKKGAPKGPEIPPCEIVT